MALRPVGVELIAQGRATFTSNIDAANNSIESMQSVAQRTASGLQSLGRKALEVGKVIATGLAVGITAAGVAVAGFLGSGLQMNAAVETATAQLNAFTGSAAETASILEWVRKESALTPFSFQDMATAAAALQPATRTANASLEELIKTAEILAASNPAEGLEGASFALREALSGDYTSLAERFNISRNSINRFKDEGLEGLDLVNAAMQELGLSADLVAAMAATTQGRWSTFQDTLQNLAATATQPIFDAMGEGLAYLQPLLDENAAAIGEMARGAIQQLIDRGKTLATQWLPRLESGFQFVKDAVTTFREAFAGNWTDSEVIQPFHRMAGAAGTFVSDVLSKIPPAIQWAQENFELLQGALTGVAAVLGGAVFSTVLASIGAAIAAINLPILALVGAAAVLGAAWNGNWGGIRDTTMQVWESLQPILQNAYTWLQTNIPMAVQTASEYWTSTLQPALQNAALWLQNTTQQAIALAGEVGTNLQAAAARAQDAFNNYIVKPAQAAYDFYQRFLVPLFREVNETVGSAQALAIRAVGYAYEQHLLPIIQQTEAFIKTNLLPIWNQLTAGLAQTRRETAEQLSPILTRLTDLLRQNIQPAVSTVVTVFNNLRNSLAEVGQWIKDIIRWLQDLQNQMNSIDFGILTPGSPTPFETGLKGVAGALREVNREAAGLNSVFNRSIPAPATGALAGITNNYNNSRTFNIPVSIGGNPAAPTIVGEVQYGVSQGLRFAGVF